jgi:hypothetical protein
MDVKVEPTEQSTHPADPFDGVQPRNSTDYFLRNVPEQLVQLSAQADLKASIVLTVCTIVLSLSFARSDDPRTSIWVLGGGLFFSLIAAILAVLPSARFLRLSYVGLLVAAGAAAITEIVSRAL